MSSVLLNHADHAGLRLVTRRGTAYGDGVMSSPLFPPEFRSAQAHYPIVFRADGDGGFHPVALFGLVEGSNLFLAHDGPDTVWDAHYLPWAIERQPFMIGRGDPGVDELLVHVDLMHPRVRLAEDDDTAVFDALGRPTEYLERSASLLRAIHEGMQTLPAFIDALLRHELLESFVMDVESARGVSRLAGFHAINEERLAALDADALAALQRAGHLAPIYMAMASLSQLRALIERHRRLGL
jgi:hypothetical protein